MPGGQAVRCGAEQRIVSRCREILLGMPVGIYAERFGVVEDADADVHLPYRIRSVILPRRLHCPVSGVLTPKPTAARVRRLAESRFIRLTQRVVDESCSLTIYTTDRRGEFDTCSWFSLWEAANAVYYKCISTNRRGLFGGLGKTSTQGRTGSRC